VAEAAGRPSQRRNGETGMNGKSTDRADLTGPPPPAFGRRAQRGVADRAMASLPDPRTIPVIRRHQQQRPPSLRSSVVKLVPFPAPSPSPPPPNLKLPCRTGTSALLTNHRIRLWRIGLELRRILQFPITGAFDHVKETVEETMGSRGHDRFHASASWHVQRISTASCSHDGTEGRVSERPELRDSDDPVLHQSWRQEAVGDAPPRIGRRQTNLAALGRARHLALRSGRS
jgi:hypothetical protein